VARLGTMAQGDGGADGALAATIRRWQLQGATSRAAPTSVGEPALQRLCTQNNSHNCVEGPMTCCDHSRVAQHTPSKCVASTLKTTRLLIMSHAQRTSTITRRELVGSRRAPAVPSPAVTAHSPSNVTIATAAITAAPPLDAKPPAHVVVRGRLQQPQGTKDASLRNATRISCIARSLCDPSLLAM